MPIMMIYTLQSSLGTSATPGIPKLWPLLTGGLYSEATLCDEQGKRNSKLCNGRCWEVVISSGLTSLISIVCLVLSIVVNTSYVLFLDAQKWCSESSVHLRLSLASNLTSSANGSITLTSIRASFHSFLIQFY